MASEKLKYNLRIASEITFFTFFILVLLLGFTQLWIAIFGIGVLVSIAFSRFYCGWMCPMGALARPIGWLYEKTRVNRRKTPSILRKREVRWMALIAFILAILYFRISGAQIPVFLIVVLIGVGGFLVFEEEAFHKHLCPYGTILCVSSKYAKYGMRVDESGCIGCGKCQKVCPNNTIVTLDSGARRIENSECLTCFRCEAACPVDAIEYGGGGGAE